MDAERRLIQKEQQRLKAEEKLHALRLILNRTRQEAVGKDLEKIHSRDAWTEQYNILTGASEDLYLAANKFISKMMDLNMYHVDLLGCATDLQNAANTLEQLGVINIHGSQKTEEDHTQEEERTEAAGRATKTH